METRSAEVKVVGEVRAVELNDDGSGVFRLRLADGSVVTGEFAADYAAIVIRAFHLHRWNHLGVKGEGQFDAEGVLRHLQGAKQLRIMEPGESLDEPVSQDPETNVLVRMVKMAEELREKYPVPEEEQLPPDFAANYKHYLYGFPKEEV